MSDDLELYIDLKKQADRIKELEQLVASLEANLEKAMEALQKIAGGKFIKDQALMHSAFECLLIARTTLAELKGKADE